MGWMSGMKSAHSSVSCAKGNDFLVSYGSERSWKKWMVTVVRRVRNLGRRISSQRVLVKLNTVNKITRITISPWVSLYSERCSSLSLFMTRWSFEGQLSQVIRHLLVRRLYSWVDACSLWCAPVRGRRPHVIKDFRWSKASNHNQTISTCQLSKRHFRKGRNWHPVLLSRGTAGTMTRFNQSSADMLADSPLHYKYKSFSYNIKPVIDWFFRLGGCWAIYIFRNTVIQFFKSVIHQQKIWDHRVQLSISDT